ncbi:MAG: MmgE/PrpD family protein, partial [Pseudomonadota bacterium]
MDGLARGLAEFACAASSTSFPLRARLLAVDAITDCVACMIAGAREPLATMVGKVVPEAGGEEAVALIGTSRKASPADAALYHGAVAHALDYDDTNHPGYGHPSAVIVSTALAVSPMAQVAGQDFVTAHILGVEVFGKLGRALNNDHYLRGWHATATFGTLAAAVVAAYLLKLDIKQTEMAIGIAASSAGGLRANFGTMVKPLHAGLAARNGVLAALLAREGFISSEMSLDHRYGYCNVFNDGVRRDLEPLSSWGNPLEILTDYGLALKPYPSCGATHTGIEAAIKLHHAIGKRSIAAVRAGVCQMAFAPLIHVMPAAPLEAKFSLHFCIAAALLEGRLNLASFTPEKVADARIRDLILRIKMELDDRFADASEFPTSVRVELADGAILEETVPLAIGKLARWMSPQDLKSK